jgi:hypothetical protein
MISASIQVADAVTPELQRLAMQLANPVALYKDVGRRVANDLKKHFRQHDSDTPNKLGGARTHFWLEIRDAVQQPVATGTGVEIAINDARFAGKVYGAHIVPREAGALTIPINQLAYGRRASVFESETGHKLFRPKGHNVLMAEIGGEEVPIYALVQAVDVPADPQALPATAVLVDAILDTGRKHLARMLARG